MNLIKKIKNYGGTRVLVLSKEDRERLGLKEGDYLKIAIEGVYKDGLGLPTPPEIDDRARYRAKEDGE